MDAVATLKRFVPLPIKRALKAGMQGWRGELPAVTHQTTTAGSSPAGLGAADLAAIEAIVKRCVADALVNQTYPPAFVRDASFDEWADIRKPWHIDGRLRQEAEGFARWADHVDHTLSKVELDGLYMEFGVYKGGSLSYFTQARPRTVFHGFDSFRGLPEPWLGAPVGHLDVGGVVPEFPHAKDRVILHKGWFNETIPPFLAKYRGPAAFIHVDCDLYTSTVTVLDLLQERIRPGTVIMFDEYITGEEKCERTALLEFCDRSGFDFRYLSRTIGAGSVAVKLAAKR